MDDILIAVGGASCGASPLMPYIGKRIEGKDFTLLAKLYLDAALLRCGFDVFDVSKTTVEPQDLIMLANRHAADGAVMMSYASFGSRKSFNDVHGSVARYSQSRYEKSKTLCEDICAKLALYRVCSTMNDGINAASCPTVVVDGGYLTYFDEAKLALDPDFAAGIAEHVAMGVCEHFGMPYIRRDDILSYPLLCSAATGKRGKKIKMLQALLSANGYALDIDGVFGKETDSAVKMFCINNEIKDDCGVSAAVWRDLLLLNLPRLEYDSKNNAVLYLQRKLNAKLYKCPQNGTLDDQTLSAVNEFLRDNESEITVTSTDGIDAETVKLISAVGGGKPRLF